MIGKVAILLVKMYQVAISPLLGPCCRFHPSCSQYCIAAIERHGYLQGVGLAVVRLFKCHPFHPGGVDLVPEPRPSRPI